MSSISLYNIISVVAPKPKTFNAFLVDAAAVNPNEN